MGVTEIVVQSVKIWLPMPDLPNYMCIDQYMYIDQCRWQNLVIAVVFTTDNVF